MEITNGPLEWSTEDIDIWRQFLKTQTGQRLLPRMLEDIPALLPGGNTNDILVRNGEVRGFQQAASTLLGAMTTYPPAPVKTAENYPLPEDDAAWADGQKVSENNK